MSENKSSPLMWILGGCGLLSVFGCCIGGAVGLYFYQKKLEETAYDGTFDPGGTGTGTFVGGEAPGPAPLPLVIPPTPRPTASVHTVIATVDQVAGTTPVRVGDTCTFVVEVNDRPDAPAGYWCHTVAMCGSTLLYGGPSNGYFLCAVYDNPPAIMGEDAETTGADSDGSFQLDSRGGRMIVRDDAGGPLGAFRVEAAVQSVL
jgi:hypothetical protein